MAGSCAWPGPVSVGARVERAARCGSDGGWCCSGCCRVVGRLWACGNLQTSKLGEGWLAMLGGKLLAFNLRVRKEGNSFYMGCLGS